MTRIAEREALRVALVTAATGVGGAEKQMYYMARGLRRGGVDVRVLNLHFGGVHEDALAQAHVPLTYVGRLPTPLLRLPAMVKVLRRFSPHVIQSIHAYTNLYSAGAGRVLGALSIGGLRGDLDAHMQQYTGFGRLLLRLPHAIAVNSKRALTELDRARVLPPEHTYYLANGVDLTDFPVRPEKPEGEPGTECRCLCAGRIVRSKRIDIFLHAVAAARRIDDGVKAVVAGDGPELEGLKQLAWDLGLLPHHVQFVGLHRDIPQLLSTVHIAVLCSEVEGTPNVLLEAMASGLPVITTPAGDAPEIVQTARAGYVVRPADPGATAQMIGRLAQSQTLRRELGSAGRRYIERFHSVTGLAERLLAIYAEASKCAFGRRHPERAQSIQIAADAARTLAGIST